MKILSRWSDIPPFETEEDEAAFWGKAIGVRYGEPFTCREPIGLRTMSGLI